MVQAVGSGRSMGVNRRYLGSSVTLPYTNREDLNKLLASMNLSFSI